MQYAEVIEQDGHQSVELPAGFRLESKTVCIRRDGDAVILEPVRPSQWPEGFFNSIRIDDPAFARPAQGKMPPAPEVA
jgi:virulence-associated protein VagC